ncbi:MAG: HIT family protein [Bacilli bacterium]|nr:HIT family protein [Bacilli bacterium]MDD7315113.1 HIT family protein [Bacilli bacterium]MDY4051758.1 HIT family protein [Bacilli bacterium]
MCIFCKIINGEIPAFKIYEDEYVLCFLDISQASEGHTLIVPKKHFENLFDVDQETLNHMAQAVKIVTNLLKEKLGVTDVNLLNNSGTNAGQTVMHLHFHIIPRKEGDNINFSFQENEPNFDKLSQTQKKLVENKLQ